MGCRINVVSELALMSELAFAFPTTNALANTQWPRSQCQTRTSQASARSTSLQIQCLQSKHVYVFWNSAETFNDCDLLTCVPYQIMALWKVGLCWFRDIWMDVFQNMLKTCSQSIWKHSHGAAFDVLRRQACLRIRDDTSHDFLDCTTTHIWFGLGSLTPYM